MKLRMVSLTAASIFSLLAILGLFSILRGSVRGMERDLSSQPLVVMGHFGGGEAVDFNAVLTEFTIQTGISTTYQQSTDIRTQLLNCTGLGNCPDVAMIPVPSLMADLVEQDALTPLDAIITDFDTNYTTTWRTLSSVNDQLYSVPFRANSKSLIWYRLDAFNVISATAPMTWTDLLSLSDQLVTSGQTPFAIGAESGDESGWPLSDWFENILIRVSGPEVHRKLVRHDIAWTDAAVIESMQRLTDIIGQDDNVVGGTNGIATTNFLDAIEMVFNTPPTATMYSGAPWILFASGSLTPGVDYDQFEFPAIDPALGKPIMGAADLAILFNETADTNALMQFLASPDAAEVWAARETLGGFTSPNSGVDPNAYPDDLTKELARQLVQAQDFVFDLDDQLPPKVQRCVWQAMMDFVVNQSQLVPIMQQLEFCATTFQGMPYQVYVPTIQKASSP